MFLDNGQKTLGWDESRLEEIWLQIESFAGYGFCLSHAVAYTYTSSRTLYLKAHYPLEFYTATLQCEKATEKIKEYMIDARNRGIEIEPVNINRSQDNFSIGSKDGKEVIYYGFAKLKGLGDEVAVRIMSNQPYNSFEDFLRRFGTEAKVLTSLISLGAFADYGNRVDLFKFYEHYKDWVKKNADREKRYVQSLERHHQKLYEELQKNYPRNNLPVGFEDEQFVQYGVVFDETVVKSLEKIKKAYVKSTEMQQKKKDEDQAPVFFEFNPGDYNLDEKWETMLSQPMEVAESTYYGFRWTHPLEQP